VDRADAGVNANQDIVPGGVRRSHFELQGSRGRNSSRIRPDFIENSSRFGIMSPMMSKKKFLPIVLVPTCILLIPAAAMLFKVDGWAWHAGDFVAAWIVIGGGMAAYYYVASKAPNRAYRVAAGMAVATGLILMWINGAVGLIGSEDNPANLSYGVVLAIGLGGAAIARLRPLGMARALFGTAVAQFLVPVVALLIWPADFSPGVVPVLGLNFCFVLLFAGSALLFRQAGNQPGGVGRRVAA
jgi:hypothetical protein